MNHPDPKLHQSVSFLKSAVRISGYLALPFSIGLGVTILVLSELTCEFSIVDSFHLIFWYYYSIQS